MKVNAEDIGERFIGNRKECLERMGALFVTTVLSCNYKGVELGYQLVYNETPYED